MLGLGLNLLSSVCARAMATPGSLASTLNLDFKSMTTLPSTITFSRPSNATYYDSTGKLTYAPNNIALYSEQFNSGVWIPGNTTITANTTVSPDGTLTADTLTSGAAATVHNIYQNNPYATTTGSYVQSLYVKKGTHRYVFISHGSGASAYATAIFDLDDGGTSATQTGTLNSGVIVSTKKESVGNGWFRLTLVASGMTSRYFQFGFANAATGNAFNIDGSPLSTTTGTETFHIWGAQFEQVTYQTTPGTYVATTTAAYYGARLDYNPATLAARGLLIEEARTNLALYSDQFNNAAWSAASLTVTANSTTSPDGTTNAETITASAGGGAHAIYLSGVIGSLASTNYAQSICVKKGTYRFIYITQAASPASSGWATAIFDLDGGGSSATQTQVGGATPGVITSTQQENIGNGWFRLTLVALTASTVRYFTFGFASAATGNSFDANGNVTFTATGTETFYAWGAQYELGSFATSYIPTAASSVARSADTASMTGTNFSSWYNATAGAVVVSWAYGMATASIPTYTSAFSMTTSGSARQLMQDLGDNTWYDGTTYINTGAHIGLIPNKTAFAYSNGNNAACLNGGTVVTSSSPLPVTPNEATIGNQTGTSRYVNGWIASIVYYPRRLPDATLQSLTS